MRLTVEIGEGKRIPGMATINRDYPHLKVETLDALLAVAVSMEDEAARRYGELAQRMASCGEAALAATFTELADLEWRHKSELMDWAGRLGRPEPPVETMAWTLPETFSNDDAVGAGQTPYQALSVAVRNEERAFAFYSYVAALNDRRPEVRKCAESFAREELRHVSQLRMLRRRAFHQERSALRPDLRSIRSVSDLRRLARGLEKGTAALAAAAADCLEKAQRDARMLRRVGAEVRIRSEAQMDDSNRSPSSRIAEAALADGRLVNDTLTADDALLLCEKDSREVLDIYLAVADRAGTELLLLEAQKLAEGTMARLALIRAEQSPSDQRPG